MALTINITDTDQDILSKTSSPCSGHDQLSQKHNQILDELDEFEHEGRAYLVCPETMPATNMETNHNKQLQSYRMDYAQGQRDLPRWKEFLEVKSS